MFRAFSAITRGCHWVCSKFGTLGGRVWKGLFSVPEYRSRQHHHYVGFSNLSPMEEARLRRDAFLEMRQW